MSFAIIADLPLGTYRAAGADGRPERIPSVTRLHSALLCAAGFGPRAVDRGDGDLCPVEADAAALSWIENNPPDSVRIPALEVSNGTAIAYRDDGTRSPDGTKIKKLPKSPHTGTAVDGQFAWIWNEPPPDPVRTALEQLCPDVAYLGTSESPVRLAAVTGDTIIDATHDRNDEASLFTPGGTGIDQPVPGRLAELTAAHDAATATPPTAARDKSRTNEVSRSPVPPRGSVETTWYSPRQKLAVDDAPWPQVFTIPIDKPLPERDRVAWAVSAHKALIDLIGFGAPPMITGAYLPGTARPANRIALHFLGPGMPREDRTPALAILIPREAGPVDLDALQTAVEHLTSLHGPYRQKIRLSPKQLRVTRGAQFWTPQPPGTVRLWVTIPPAVPDTRGARGTEWNFAHAALLSLGFVWKDLLRNENIKVSGRGDTYYRNLAAAISDKNAGVAHVRAVRASDAPRYAHKVNKDAVVRPYTACLSLGNLAGAQTIAAIGQSRHLGGGLLVPFDVPEGTNIADIRLPGENGTRS
jgi:CRISPR-associated protein Csb2